MLIRWSPAAAVDLPQISDYIRADDPAAAQRVAKRIYDHAATLGTRPHHRKGWPRVRDTRIAFASATPYRSLSDIRGAAAVEIVNIIHGAQRWPPRDRLG
jgi:toxin ParE1/3/4